MPAFFSLTPPLSRALFEAASPTNTALPAVLQPLCALHPQGWTAPRWLTPIEPTPSQDTLAFIRGLTHFLSFYAKGVLLVKARTALPDGTLTPVQACITNKTDIHTEHFAQTMAAVFDALDTPTQQIGMSWLQTGETKPTLILRATLMPLTEASGHDTLTLLSHTQAVLSKHGATLSPTWLC